uniref:Uncharacterized protein n=1 Tax=Timema bartmani TaxID=61472 RepID=A0A7R9I1W8_9NEOP|nr:unnamed protein product [Timema bartmani]
MPGRSGFDELVQSTGTIGYRVNKSEKESACVRCDARALIDARGGWGPSAHVTQMTSPVLASVVLTDSSQLTSDGFEKPPDQIMLPQQHGDSSTSRLVRSLEFPACLRYKLRLISSDMRRSSSRSVRVSGVDSVECYVCSWSQYETDIHDTCSFENFDPLRVRTHECQNGCEVVTRRDSNGELDIQYRNCITRNQVTYSHTIVTSNHTKEDIYTCNHQLCNSARAHSSGALTLLVAGWACAMLTAL